MLACERIHLCGLGLGDFGREDAGNATTLGMDMQHDLHRLFSGVLKELLQNLDHKLHRGVIVIDDDHFVLRGRLQFGLGVLHGQPTVTTISVLGMLLTHVLNISAHFGDSMTTRYRVALSR